MYKSRGSNSESYQCRWVFGVLAIVGRAGKWHDKFKREHWSGVYNDLHELTMATSERTGDMVNARTYVKQLIVDIDYTDTKVTEACVIVKGGYDNDTEIIDKLEELFNENDIDCEYSYELEETLASQVNSLLTSVE